MNKQKYRAILCVLVYIAIESCVFKNFKNILFLYWSLIEDLTGLFSAPPPKNFFRKEMDNIFLTYLCKFSIVVLLTKI